MHVLIVTPEIAPLSSSACAGSSSAALIGPRTSVTVLRSAPAYLPAMVGKADALAGAGRVDDATRLLEQRTGRRPTVLAYPYGDTNGLAIELLRRRGYRAAFTVVREANPFFAPAFRFSRSMVYGDHDLARFERTLQFSDRRALR